MIKWLCLVNRPSVDVEWLIAAHDRAPSHDGGSMCFYVSDQISWVYVRPCGATREKWRIPDGKGESGLFSFSELRRW
jgi:hypothetical protein